jgi:hypothetical protein
MNGEQEGRSRMSEQTTTEAPAVDPENITNRPDETAGIEDNSIPGEEDVVLTGERIAPAHEEGRSILTAEQIRVLGATRINPGRVKELNKNSYLQAWDVKATLLKVFGWGGFSTEVTDVKVIGIREHAAGSVGHVERFDVKKNGQTVKHAGEAKTPQAIVMVTMRLTLHNIGPKGQDVVHEETAVGVNSQWDIGEAVDTAVKSAESDALKRCAIFLGTQFGLSLYNAGSKADVVNRVFVPWQGKVMADLRPTDAGATQASLNRATGGAK